MRNGHDIPSERQWRNNEKKKRKVYTSSERQAQDNEMRKRKVYSSEKMLESRADSSNESNQRLVHVLQDFFELGLLTKYEDYFEAL